VTPARPAFRPITMPERARMRAMRRDGVSLLKIAAALGIPERTVRRHTAGIEARARHPRATPPETIAEIRRLRLTMSAPEVAAELGCHEATVRRHAPGARPVYRHPHALKPEQRARILRAIEAGVPGPVIAAQFGLKNKGTPKAVAYRERRRRQEQARAAQEARP
jgi:predicted transcriptional regulator